MPVGRCVILAEFWCLFLCWPPAPVPEYHSSLKSESDRLWNFSELLSLQLMIATVTVEV
jgi:hypothetical protein